MNGPRMPCHITDGVQFDEWEEGETLQEMLDEDLRYWERKEEIEESGDAYDPTPWCHVCHATTKADCDCLPIAENN